MVNEGVLPSFAVLPDVPTGGTATASVAITLISVDAEESALFVSI